MSDDRVRRVAARYSADAEAYRELWVPEMLPLGHRLLERLPLREARRVLDLGAGVGALVPAIREQASKAAVVVADRAEGMIRLAPRDAGRLVADASVLPFGAAAFDALVLAFVLFHVPDPPVALGEVRRVLRPGGSLGLATWGDNRSREGIRIWNEELDAHGAEELAGLANHDLTDTPEKVEVLLRAAGFDDIRSEVVRSEFPVTHEEFVALRTRIGSCRVRLETLDPPARAACVGRATQRIRELDPRELIDDADAILTAARA